jgi:hypothetical protein
MTNRVVLALFATISTALLSCSHDLQKSPPIKRIINEFGNGNRFDAALLIPMAGCPGCISGAEMFVKKNLDNCKILFLFTRINSEKTLRSKLGVDALPENLIFDRENRFALAPDFPESEYPVVIYFNRDNKSSLDAISPDNYVAYEKLINFVDNKVRFYDLARAMEADASATGLSDLCNGIKYIPLARNRDALLSPVLSYWTDSGKIFISDTEEKIIAFSYDGIPSGRIGKKGEGPEEYRTLVGGKFILDKKRKEVIIPDMGGKKLVFYDYRGEFVKSVPLNYIPDDLAIFNDSLLLIQTQPFQDLQNQICNIVIIDRGGGQVATIPAGQIPSLNFISSAKLDATFEEVWFEEPYNDTIYRIGDFTKHPSAVVHMGKYKPPVEIFGDISRWPEYSTKYVFNRYLFHHCQDLWFSFYKHTTLYSGFFRYTDSMPVLLFRGQRGGGITDDIDSGPPFNPFFKAGDEFMVDFIEPSELLEKKYETIRQESPLREIRENISTEDNPVVRLLIR